MHCWQFNCCGRAQATVVNWDSKAEQSVCKPEVKQKQREHTEVRPGRCVKFLVRRIAIQKIYFCLLGSVFGAADIV
jgi:hypothetical protein